MEFNWEEFILNDNIAVHCATEKQAIGFCKQMHEHGMEWQAGQSYLKTTNWEIYEKETCYEADGTFASLEYYENNNYTILEWSNYEKENSMNLELTNLTDEQKQQIIELAKKFEQENEVDKLNRKKDWTATAEYNELIKARYMADGYADDLFSIGLTAHTKEDAEKTRRRLIVEKELRDWAKKCKEHVEFGNGSLKYSACYNGRSEEIFVDSFCSFTTGNIIFTDESILKQAIESIGQERLIRDYFGIE